MFMMKKIFLFFAVLVFSASVLCGCEQSNQNNKADAPPLKEVYTVIQNEVTLPDMLELKEKSDLENYYGIKEDDVADFYAAIDSSGVGQDEIVFIKAKDAASAGRVEERLNSRYDSKLKQNESYNPKEAAKIKKCSVKKNGNYVSMVISDDAEKIEQIYNNSVFV